MITVEKEFELNYEFMKGIDADPEKSVFFDIETTGLSSASSALYLIGALFCRNKRLFFRQWFVDSFSAERPVLEAFSAFLKDFDTVIHYNGDRFDIPYITECLKEYSIEAPFPALKSIDLLKLLRKSRKLLSLPDCRLKTAERFLGIYREDKFSGGELIEVYENYLKTKDEALLKELLLHNEEDILNMPRILPALFYKKALETDTKRKITEVFSSRNGTKLFVTLEYEDPFPVKFEKTTESGVKLLFQEHFLYLSLPMISGELKIFYPNPKDYYYLPAEDTAVHKKIGEYVDKTHRVRATKENAYRRMEGFFLPAPVNDKFPKFRKAYADKEEYILYEEGNFEAYLRQYLSEQC